MEIKKDQEEQVVNFGAFEYDAQKISSLLGCSEKEIICDMANEKSQLSLLLKKGKDMADYSIDLKLFELARTGDVRALDKLDMRRRDRQSMRKKRKS